jgi:hypothetical protein
MPLTTQQIVAGGGPLAIAPGGINAPQPIMSLLQGPPVNVQPPTPFAPPSGFNIGGSSGWDDPTPSTNTLGLNINGLNVSYDIGPNTDAFARGAYNYLDNNFKSSENLVGGTIAQSEDFLTRQTAPLTDFNTTVLPSMFGTLQAQNQSIGFAAINAQQTTAQASIAASRASASEANSAGGGGCYITTAACDAMGEADDGPTLTALRKFRNRFMFQTKGRLALVEAYYKKAPALVTKIKARADWREYLEELFRVYIVPARDAIERGDDDTAFCLYCRAIYHVERTA